MFLERTRPNHIYEIYIGSLRPRFRNFSIRSNCSEDVPKLESRPLVRLFSP